MHNPLADKDEINKDEVNDTPKHVISIIFQGTASCYEYGKPSLGFVRVL